MVQNAVLAVVFILGCDRFRRSAEKRKVRHVVICLIAVLWAPSLYANTMKNTDIINLSKNGLKDDAIIAVIQATPNDFSIDADSLIKLKASGVSDAVIKEMILHHRLAAPIGAVVNKNVVNTQKPGLYLVTDDTTTGGLKLMSPNFISSATTRGAFISGFTLGIAKMKSYSTLSGESAKMVTSTRRPVFILTLDSINNGLNSGSQAIRSPSDMILSRFEVKKGSRHFFVGEGNRFGSRGLVREDSLPFDVQQLSDYDYKITFGKDLEAGEYGFLIPPANNGQSTGTLVAFDFSVK